jgi:WD40 repeat protein
MRISLGSLIKTAALVVLLVGGCALDAESQLGAQQSANTPAKTGAKSADKPKQNVRDDSLPEGALMRLGTRQRRVGAAQIAMTADGKSIISVVNGKYVSVWDAQTGELREKRALPVDFCNSFSWLSPDGRWLITDGGRPKRVILVNIRTGKIEREIIVKDLELIDSADVSRRTNRIAVSYARNEEEMKVKVWDIATGTEVFARTVDAKANRVNDPIAFGPDEKLVLANFSDGAHGLMCFDLEAKNLRWRLKHCYAGERPQFTPDGRFVLTGGSKPPLNAVNLSTGREVELEKMPGNLPHVRLLPGGKQIAMVAQEGIVIWDRDNGKEERVLKGAPEEFIVAPDGQSIVTSDGSLQRWDLATGKPMYSDTFALGHVREVLALKFAADGKRVVSGSRDGSVRLWDATTEKPLRVWAPSVANLRSPLSIFVGDQELGSWKIDISRDGKWVVSTEKITDRAERLFVRDVKTGVSRAVELPEQPNNAPEPAICQLRISPDGRSAVAIVVQEETAKFTEWDLKSGKSRRAILLDCGCHDLASNCRWWIKPSEAPWALAVADVAVSVEIAQLEHSDDYRGVAGRFARFSADSSRIIGTWDKYELKNGEPVFDFRGLRIWETATGRSIADFRPKSFAQAGLHSNHRVAFTMDGTCITFWDLATGKTVCRRTMPRENRDAPCASCVALSPDGTKMATGHADGSIFIWNVPIKLSPLGPVDAKALESMWRELASADARKAWQMIWRLAEAPNEALPALRQRLKPVPVASLEELQPQIAALDDDQFARREKAMKELRELGPRAEAGLRAARQGRLSAEQRNRIDQLLTALGPQSPIPPGELAELRALRVLEQIGSPEAMKLVEELATGAESARLTREAKDMLQRKR